MKGNIRIGGAVLCGVVIIALGFYARAHVGSTESGALVVEAPPKQYITEQDANNNGTPDWEEEITKNIIASVNSSSSVLYTDDATYTPPTTFTGKFSEAFFKDYLVRKGSGQSMQDPTALVNDAVKNIQQSTESKRHSRLELVIVPDSASTIREYGNQVGKIILSHKAKGENEGVILQKALQTNDASLLTQLVPVRDAYTAMLRDTLNVPTPESLVNVQLNLINTYEALLTDIIAMQGMFEDPLYGLARVKRYPGDAQSLVDTFKMISTGLTAQGVTYANTEPGALFYFFNS